MTKGAVPATPPAPVDDLIRMLVPRIELRAAESEDALPTLFGHFAVFDEWTEIDSFWEGKFLERIAPGAFRKTIRENRDSIRVLYDHGMDPSLGNKPLGPIEELREDDVGAYYEAPLIDTDYNRDFVIPAAEAGLLGASFRFSVKKETWEEPEDEGKLRRRTLNEVRLFEFGPVTFPAYQAATAGVRSRADMQLWQRLDEKGRADLVRLMYQALDSTSEDGADEVTPRSEAASPAEEPAIATPFAKYREQLHEELVRQRTVLGPVGPEKE